MATENQLAVLIDFENVGLSSIRWLLDQISDVGRIIIKRAYADWSSARSKRDQLLELGIEPIHLFQSTASGKNSSDIRLVIDAVDLLYGSPVDTFVIVSSDSDFVPLVSKLRASGKTVIGAGRKAATASTLVISCDRYFYLEQAEEPAPDRPDRPRTRRRTRASLLVRGVEAAMDEQGRVVGSRLRQTLQRLDPSFDFRAMGYSTFRRYLDASADVKVIVSRGAGDVTVELASAADQATATASTSRPATRARPTPKPTPAATPAPEPAPRARPAPAATPAPEPAPRARPAPAPTPAPEPAPRARPAPAPTPAPEPAPEPEPAPMPPPDPKVWGPILDDMWSSRVSRTGQAIGGRTAASDAAKALGIKKLGDSPYKTLQGLLDASDLLNGRWGRNRNLIVER